MGTETPIYNIYVYIYTEWHNVAYQHRMMKCPILHIYTHLMVYTAQMEIHKATHTHTKKKSMRNTRLRPTVHSCCFCQNKYRLYTSQKKKKREKVQEPITW